MPEIKQDIRSRTFVVAANDSLHKNMADYACGATGNEVEINHALNSLPAQGGSVILLEGTFAIDHPIVFPADNITLRGQGRSTLINGDALPTGEHAIQISGFTNCVVKKLAVRTEDGGGKFCHCILIEDGANGFQVEYVTVVASDSDGIHIDGTSTLFGHIHDCNIESADEVGINAGTDAGNFMYRLHVVHCDITGTGGAGMYLNRCLYAVIEGNIVYLCGANGIHLMSNSSLSIVNNNLLFGNTGIGVYVATSDHIGISNNACQANTQWGIALVGADECVLEGNICTANTFSGIDINNTSTECDVVGNHCCENDRHGIDLNGSRNLASGNFAHENGLHGINVSGAECEVSENYAHMNSKPSPGTYHGINLEGTADRCMVNSNHCNDDGAHQEDGIHLGDGASHVQIVGNYCHNGMGDGIELEANNDYCTITGNFCYDNDDYGIAVLTSDQCTITGNNCVGNGSHGIYVFRSSRNTLTGNSCCSNGADGINVTGDAIANSDYNTLTGNTCTLNGGDGIEIIGDGDANKNIVLGNQLLGNTGAALVNNGTDTQIGHNISV